MRGVYYGGERPERAGGQPHPPAFSERNQPAMTIHFCAMCDFETDDEAEAYEHDCMSSDRQAGTNP